ncbi:MAG: queuosine precursor transporter [Cytophagaceae bacterium]|nr:queuosine precursor transporter [Cytophagaceae bacterium]MDW8456626.1 queuosine precursor transporter [Cytophagaceae bacterium]
MNKKKHILYWMLSAIFITNALLAELIGSKIFSLEKTLGYQPLKFNLFSESSLSLSFTAGVLIWPFVFVITDLINEYFGKEGVRRISFMASACIAYAFLIIWMAIQVAPDSYWIERNPMGENNTVTIDTAYRKIFGQGLDIIVASLTAFLIGQFIDAFVFEKIKNKTGKKWIWMRATGSTMISQLFDSFIVLFIAFYLLKPSSEKWSIDFLLSVSLMNYMYKLCAAILLTPVLYGFHTLIDRYLQHQEA